MPSVLQISVGLNPVVVWNGRQATTVNSLLLWNSDTTNTIYIGSESNISSESPNTIPLPPNGSISVDPNSPWWVVGAVVGSAPLVVLPNGQNFFLGFTQGQGNLAIPQFQSPGFDPDTGMGWALYQNGDASFNQVTITVQATGIAVLIYYPTPGLGNLIGSWTASPTSTTDQYGNVIPPGLYVNNGQLSGVALNSPAMVGGTILNTLLSASTITASNLSGGTSYEQTITFDTGGGVLLCYSSTTTTYTQTANGTYSVTLPDGVSSINNAYCWAAGAGGDGGSTSEGGNGGGAGEFAGEPIYTPSVNPFTVVVGNGGSGSTTGQGHGTNGGNSAIDAAVNGVLANGGNGDGTPGTGSTNTIHHDGGTGGASNGNSGGASGANSGNPTAKGNNGIAPSGSSGAASPAGQTNSGTGGAGGSDGGNGSNGGSPGAGGGGAGMGTSTSGSKSKTYSALWYGSYYGPDGGTPNAGRSNSTMYQGGETSGGGSFNGNQRCCFAFNRAEMASDFAGYTMTQCVITVTNQHTWYDSGMTILFDIFAGLPGSPPGSYPESAYVQTVASGGIAEGTTHSYGLGAAVAGSLVNASNNGFGFGNQVAAQHPYNLNYYGFFAADVTVTLTGTISESGSNNSGEGADGKVSFSYVTAQALVCALSPVAGTDANGNGYAAGYTGPVTALEPGSVPAAAETWHAMTLANNWGNQGGSAVVCQYRLLPDNVVEIVGVLNTNGGATSRQFATLPVGYRPASNSLFVFSAYSTNATTTLFWGECDNTGALQIAGGAVTSSLEIAFYGRIPLQANA